MAWLRKPTAKDLQQAEIAKQQHQALFVETILLNCFLTGDEAIKTVNVQRLVPGSLGYNRTFELTKQMRESGALVTEALATEE